MELISSKCPNCGSEIEVNREEKTGVCVHCNSTFLVDDAIKKYITNNSYNIEHATIIKNDFGDDVLRNEIDKYIAQYNLENYNLLEPIVNELKTKFPHKGLARVAILHYQFAVFFTAIGGYDIFVKEFETIESKANNYNPKRSKHIPPYSSFLTKTDMIEMQYYEELEDFLTEEDKEDYEGIVTTTIGYVKKLNHIILFNKKMKEKFDPFENTLEQKLLRKEKRKHIFDKVKKYRFLVSFVSVLLVLAIVTIVNFCSLQAIKSNREFIDVANTNYLNAPIKTYASGTYKKTYGNYEMTFSKRYYYTITGRVAGIHKYLFKFTLENQIANYTVGLSWGDLSSQESAKLIQFKYSILSNGFQYKPIRNDLFSYFSVNRLIPADEKVEKLFKVIKDFDMIQIEGYLVDIFAQGKNNFETLSTSTELDDRAEWIYVTNIKWINQK